MRKLTLFAGVLSLLLFSCALKTRQIGAGQLPGELMLRSGLEKQLEQVPRIMVAVLERSRSNDALTKEIPQSEFDGLRSRMASAFDPSSLKEIVQRRLLSDLTESDIRTVLGWLDSPLGRRITMIEEEASTPDAYAGQREAGGAPEGDRDRAARIRRLDEALKGTESALNAALSMQVALMTAVSSALPPEERMTVDELLEMEKEMGPYWRPKAEEQISAYYLNVYRSLSNDELDRYIAFGESPAGRKYHAAVAAGVMDAMLEAARRLEHRIRQPAVPKESI